MFITELVLAAIGGVFAVAAAVHNYRQKNNPCNTCAHLCCKGGAVWRYSADYECPLGSFDHPPQYCAKYKKRKTDNTTGPRL